MGANGDAKMELQTLTVTLAQAQVITGLGRDHLRALIRDGKIPNVGPRTRVRIPRAALERWLDAGGANPYRASA